MDKHLNTEELKFQSLLEQKNFDELSEEEKSFVVSFSSEEEYVLQRKIITNASHLYESNNVVAPPMAISNEVVNSIWFKKAPVYQTLLAVAATVVIMLLLRTPQDSLVNKEVVTEYVTQTDTVYETKLVRDTFVEYVDREIVVEQIKYIEIEKSNANNSSNVSYPKIDETGRVLSPSQSIVLPEINNRNESVAANSYKNDPTSILVSDFRMSE